MTARQWLMARLPPGVSLWLHAYKAYYKSEPELPWALTKVSPRDLVVDVGSNVGIYTFWLAKRVGLAGRVLALDPAEPCVRYLRTAALQLGLSQVSVLHCGASDKSTTLELHIPIETSDPKLTRATFRPIAGPAQAVSVQVSCLDELLSGRDRPASFIKCDTEGHEFAVLRGAQGILTSDRPTLLVECEQRHLNYDMQDTFDYLLNLGYCGWFLDARGMPRPLGEFSPSSHQLPYLDDLSSPNYVNNFLFDHPAKATAARRPTARGR